MTKDDLLGSGESKMQEDSFKRNEANFTKTSDIMKLLPDNAKDYLYHDEHQEVNWDSVSQKAGTVKNIGRIFSFLMIYPLFRMRYLSTDEIIAGQVSGEDIIRRGPGYQWLVSPIDSFQQKQKISEFEEISQGTLRIFRIPTGHIGYGATIQNANLILFTPGMHQINTLEVRYDGCKPLTFNELRDAHLQDVQHRHPSQAYKRHSHKVVDVNGYKFIKVNNGECAIINREDGNIGVLEQGVHFITQHESYRTHVSKIEEVIDIDGLFHTADSISLIIKSDLFYTLHDPLAAFSTAISDIGDMEKTIISRAKDILLAIVRGKAFYSHQDDFGASYRIDSVPVAAAQVANVASEASISDVGAVVNGFGKVNKVLNEEFLIRLNNEFGHIFGFEFTKLSIINIEFSDKNLQNQIDKFGVQITRQNAELISLKQQRDLELNQESLRSEKELRKAQNEQAEAEAKGEVEIAKAVARAKTEAAFAQAKAQEAAKIIETESKNYKLQVTSRAEADAFAATLEADAKAYSVQKLANAEAEAAAKLDTPFARQRELLKIQADAFGKTFGDKKGIFMSKIPDFVNADFLGKLQTTDDDNPSTVPSRSQPS